MANTYTYSGPGTRWAEGDPTSEDKLNIARINVYHVHEALNALMDTDAATAALLDGVTATTQSAADNSTKIATTAYVDAAAVSSFGNGSTGSPSIYATADTNTGVWFPAADTFAISTGGTERLRLDSSGFIGIGTTTPGYSTAFLAAGMITTTIGNATYGAQLELMRGTDADATWVGVLNFSNANNGSAGNGATGRGIAQIIGESETSDSNTGDDSGGHLLFYTKAEAGGSAERLRINSAGHGSAGSDNTYTWGTSGLRWSDIYAASGSVNTSDERLKTDIVDSPLGLDFINDLRAIRYRVIERRGPIKDKNGDIVQAAAAGVRPHYGLSAQQVKTVLDGLGIDFAGYIDPSVTGDDGGLGLRYTEFIGPIIKAIQELTGRVVLLETP